MLHSLFFFRHATRGRRVVSQKRRYRLRLLQPIINTRMFTLAMYINKHAQVKKNKLWRN